MNKKEFKTKVFGISEGKGIKEKQDSWDWFGLSYASWLVVPRIALQSMPEKWQNKFLTCLLSYMIELSFLMDMKT